MAQDDGLYPAFPKEPVPDEADNAERLSAAEQLELLATKIRVCRNCDLALNRKQAVPGEGNPHATIMFVGEAPGATEDETGRPFVGASGRFLDSMLADIGLQRADVFIANINRCRPPENRDPNSTEIEACQPWMRAQIHVIKPKVICTLGRFAMNTLIDPKLKITRDHGIPIEKGEILFIPLFHPAAALHRESLRETLKEDMRQVRVLLEERGLW
ncbi:MAG TPA: uracil-DNA glycosylase [Armatimonadota bacterium]|nr:uracil-DNA glycosylase [Armatimonadota bacterium]